MVERILVLMWKTNHAAFYIFLKIITSYYDLYNYIDYLVDDFLMFLIFSFTYASKLSRNDYLMCF